MIGRRSKPHTSLLIVRNEDGTPERVRVTGKSARHEARLVKAAIQHHGDRVVSVHDSSGTPLYSQGAWPESPAGDRVDRAAAAPRPQPDPAPPALSRTMDREAPSLQIRKAAGSPRVADLHDLFADAGHRYDSPHATALTSAPAATAPAPVADPAAGSGKVLINGGDGGYGSAATVGPQEMMTNDHVVDGADTLEVETPNGDTLSAHVMERIPERDIAVLSVPGLQAAPSPMSHEQIASGEQLTIVAYPNGGDQMVEPTRLVGYSQMEAGTNSPAQPGMPLMLLDTPVEKGTSGGGVFDKSGRHVGTIFASDDDYGYAIPNSTITSPAGGTPIQDDDALAASRAPGISR